MKEQTAITISMIKDMSKNDNHTEDQALCVIDDNDEQRMTSLEIAELTCKQHKDVLKAIRNMEPAWERVHGRKFALMSREIEIGNGAVRQVPCYSLTQTECLYIATKFNDEARARLVLRWKQLEEDRREALQWQQWLARWGRKGTQPRALLGMSDEEVLDEADDILGEELDELNNRSDSCYTPTEIGKPFGLEGRDLNSFLADQGIIRWGHGQWELTKNYLHRGLTENRSVYIHSRNGRRKLVSRLVWTERGREFVLNLIK